MKKIIIVISILCLVAFYFFSREVKRGFLKSQDFNMTVRLQDHMPVRLDGVWEAVSLPVTPTPSILVVGLLTIAALVDIKKKKIRLRALVIPLLFGALVWGELYGKSVVHHPSPPFFMIKNPTTIFPQFYVNEQFSYPSGHTARAVFFGFVLFTLVARTVIDWVRERKRMLIMGVLIGAYILAVAIGKIYLGQHWMSDIIGGGLLGAGFGMIILGIY